MITQIRPGIHHLGDQIIWVNSELAKGNRNFDVELTNGVYDLFKDITWSNKRVRYQSAFELDFSCKFERFDSDKFTTCEHPKNKFLTYQFDTTQIHSKQITPEVISYVVDKNYQEWILNKYRNLGYELVDVGGMRFTLQETAYIMSKSCGHIGASSAFGVFSRCVGVPFTHIYYNCNLRKFMEILPDHYAGYMQLFTLNGIRHIFKDENLNISL